MNFSDNIILLTDSYKVGHFRQYPPNTTNVYSYFECRGGKFKEPIFFGLQYIIKRYLCGQVITEERIAQAKEVFGKHLQDDSLFNEAGWRYILEKHNGHLPVRIMAVPEGTPVPVKNALFTIENTDPQCFWLTNYLETLLVQCWYPLSVASNSREQKKLLKTYLEKTSDSVEGLEFKLHDFGFRGVSSVEQAGIGGCAHLINFLGTDTLAGVMVAREFYDCDMAGFSIPASEHSTMTSWGRSGEADAYANMLEQFPSGLVACVSDSYDIFNACENLWGGELKARVLARGEKGGTLVVRPDSGDPPTVVLRCLDLLGKQFGTTLNSKGYKMLPSCIRLIQGDGVNYDMIAKVLALLDENKWSSDNVAFGSGGSLLQRLDRDTQKVAVKCSSIVRDGQLFDVFKDPATDPGKKSKKGRLTLERDESTGELVTRTNGEGDAAKNIMQCVFEDGRLVIEQSFADIRARAAV